MGYSINYWCPLNAAFGNSKPLNLREVKMLMDITTFSMLMQL